MSIKLCHQCKLNVTLMFDCIASPARWIRGSVVAQKIAEIPAYLKLAQFPAWNAGNNVA
ncbi:hypothetical protein [Sedimentitalea sp.]|uniref:hypothetical protein n=1 Tax=Sedimentitalea sp. TaxID=2048915 RepID=UPI00329A2BD5